MPSIGAYEVERELGRGAMGIVYLVRAPGGEPLALKVLTASEPDALERFRREAGLLGFLGRHAHIVSLRDVGTHQGRPFLVMSYVAGETLERRMTSGAPREALLRLLAPIARALHFAHEAGVIHRDVKPANVLLGEGDHPWLSDFGVARIQVDKALTATGEVLGTPTHMAPEQLDGRREGLDRRCDVWALGVILFQVLTGRLPFEGPTAVVARKVLLEDAPAPSSVTPDVPLALDRLCRSALSRDPAARPPTAEVFARRLEEALAPAPAARPSAALVGVASTVAALALGILAAAGARAGAASERDRFARQRDEAVAGRELAVRERDEARAAVEAPLVEQVHAALAGWAPAAPGALDVLERGAAAPGWIELARALGAPRGFGAERAPGGSSASVPLAEGMAPAGRGPTKGPGPEAEAVATAVERARAMRAGKDRNLALGLALAGASPSVVGPTRPGPDDPWALLADGAEADLPWAPPPGSARWRWLAERLLDLDRPELAARAWVRASEGVADAEVAAGLVERAAALDLGAAASEPDALAALRAVAAPGLRSRDPQVLARARGRVTLARLLAPTADLKAEAETLALLARDDERAVREAAFPARMHLGEAHLRVLLSAVPEAAIKRIYLNANETLPPGWVALFDRIHQRESGEGLYPMAVLWQPDLAILWVKLSIARRFSDPRAAAHLARVASTFEDSDETWYWRGRYAWDRGDGASAEEALRTALARQVSLRRVNYWHHVLLAEVLLARGGRREAEEALAVLRDVQPNFDGHGSVWQARARAHALLGQEQDVIRCRIERDKHWRNGS